MDSGTKRQRLGTARLFTESAMSPLLLVHSIFSVLGVFRGLNAVFRCPTAFALALYNRKAAFAGGFREKH
jgi:hypothetical protein